MSAPSDPDRHNERERLWTPWRMRYIGGQERETGCVFCKRLARNDDVESLILHRGEHAFLIVNLFPYTTGHIMIVPNHHADDPGLLDAVTLHEMSDFLPICLRALRRVLNCQGFNVGFNIGSAAGAGIAEHLHEHIVPRWSGDANFMPVLASTIAMPELIPSTYAKVRAELQRELTGNRWTRVILLLENDQTLVLTGDTLPRVKAGPNEAIWQAAMAPFRGWISELEVAGWAGTNRATSDISEKGNADSALVLRGTRFANQLAPAGHRLTSIREAWTDSIFPEDDGVALRRGVAQLSPSILGSLE